jgi:DNA modification methylase
VAVTLLEGDCRALLPTLPATSVHCVVTSPPYWGLRDYGTATWEGGDAACDHREVQPQNRPGRETPGGRGGTFPTCERGYREVCRKCGARRLDQQLGLEPTPEVYVETMVGVFREVRRVLRDDGTLWLNMGDSYANTGNESPNMLRKSGAVAAEDGYGDGRAVRFTPQPYKQMAPGLKPKDLVGIPWRLAFALQADGWFLRADIIWAKKNPMPESVTDRPTKAHEYVFLLSKAARYFYDADAVREPATYGENLPTFRGAGAYTNGRSFKNSTVVESDGARGPRPETTSRNLRSVWTIPSAPFPDAHFATFPPALASRCIQAGTSERGCCRACGAPWARVVDATPMILARSERTHALGRTRSSGTMLAPPSRETTGWEPSCACDAPPVPCTVLDPFAGSGTVGEVAEQLGRHSLLLELSPTYVQMAAERTAQCGLFTARHGIC